MLVQEKIYPSFWAAAFVLALTLFYDLTKNKFKLDKLTSTAILIAISSACRILFLLIPTHNIYLAPFVIIISGIVFGPALAFEVGAVTAVVSSFVTGFDWSVLWLMFSFGLVGLFSGFLSKSLKSNKIWRVFFGLICGIACGWLMNFRYVVYHVSFADLSYLYLSSLFNDVLNGSVNALLMMSIGNMCIDKVEQLKQRTVT